MEKMQKDNAEKLENMRRTVDEKLHETLNKRLGESFSLVNERLEQVYKGLGEMQNLATGVGDLKRVLSNVKTRGIWGEVQLGALLSQMLAPAQYAENVAVVPGSSERVEFAVILPGKDETNKVYLPIDSKFPLEGYERLLSASEGGDAAQVASAANDLCNAIRTEAKRISKKYIAPPHTTDFAVMFLATEGLYAEALRSRGLMEELQQNQRVLVAGPSTLSALLSSLQLGFRTLAIEQRSAEVWQLLGAVKTEFGRFSDLLDQTQQRLHQAGETIQKASARTRAINRRLRDVEALNDAQSAKLLPLDDEEDTAKNAE
jgi:DNA recombination protein RmuC